MSNRRGRQSFGSSNRDFESQVRRYQNTFAQMLRWCTTNAASEIRTGNISTAPGLPALVVTFCSKYLRSRANTSDTIHRASRAFCKSEIEGQHRHVRHRRYQTRTAVIIIARVRRYRKKRSAERSAVTSTTALFGFVPRTTDL